jgi:hypothetical protein
MMKRAAAGAVTLACGALVVVRAAMAPEMAPAAGRADAATRGAIARDIAGLEPSWRGEAEEAFPSDLWSQRDDFHAREAQRVREIAADKSVPVEDVLRAVDEDLHSIPHAAAEVRGTRAVPCKPRPFYD